MMFAVWLVGCLLVCFCLFVCVCVCVCVGLHVVVVFTEWIKVLSFSWCCVFYSCFLRIGCTVCSVRRHTLTHTYTHTHTPTHACTRREPSSYLSTQQNVHLTYMPLPMIAGRILFDTNMKTASANALYEDVRTVDVEHPEEVCVVVVVVSAPVCVSCVICMYVCSFIVLCWA